MGLLEVLFERSNPGPVGDIGLAEPAKRNPNWVPLRAVIAVAVSLMWFDLFVIDGTSDTLGRIGRTVVSIVYLILGYWLRPRPATSNMGIAGTPFDHPLRFSDDINRWLVILMALLWPGRFIAEAFVDAWRMLQWWRE